MHSVIYWKEVYKKPIGWMVSGFDAFIFQREIAGFLFVRFVIIHGILIFQTAFLKFCSEKCNISHFLAFWKLFFQTPSRYLPRNEFLGVLNFSDPLNTRCLAIFWTKTLHIFKFIWEIGVCLQKVSSEGDLVASFQTETEQVKPWLQV